MALKLVQALDLQAFCDSSGKGTAVAVYAVMYQESDIHQSLLAAKASLAKKGLTMQRTKKVVSNSPGLMDFAIRLVNSLLNLPDGK